MVERAGSQTIKYGVCALHAGYLRLQTHSEYAISWDPKHVGVTFNFMCFKLLYNIDFNF
jgi:hypothetical protein